MGFNTEFHKEKVIITFDQVYNKGDIMDSFISLTENVSLKKMNHLIFDYSKVNSFPIPEEYITHLKLLTKFSLSWNKNINIISIATNSNIKKMVTGIINYNKGGKLQWNYMLFESLNDALKWCEKLNKH